MRGLGRSGDALAAHTFCLGMLGFGFLLLAPSRLPPRRLPAPHQKQAFGVLAITLIPTPWLVLLSTPMAQTNARPRSAATVVWLIMTLAHGRVFSQGTVRGECANVLLGRLCKSVSQSTLVCLNQTTKKTVGEGLAKETRKKTLNPWRSPNAHQWLSFLIAITADLNRGDGK